MRTRIGISYRVGPIGLLVLGLLCLFVGAAIFIFWAAVVALAIVYVLVYCIVLYVKHRRQRHPKEPHEPRHYGRSY